MADGLNAQAAWRLEVAYRLAEIIQTFPGVRGILVAGSVSRGWADKYSDLELAIFWEPLPADEQRLALIAALGGRLVYGYDGPAQEDQLIIDGLQVDLWQNSVAQEEAVFDEVLKDYSTDLGSSNFMDTVRAGIPLYGEDLLGAWKQKAAQYPRELAARVVWAQLPAFHPGYLDVLARREAIHGFFAQVIQLQQAMFLALLALNRMYFPTYKWMLPVVEQMEIKPVGIGARFRGTLNGKPDESAQEMLALLDETLRLVESHLPEVDTRAARQRLAYRRTAISVPPGFLPPPAPAGSSMPGRPG